MYVRTCSQMDTLNSSGAPASVLRSQASSISFHCVLCTYSIQSTLGCSYQCTVKGSSIAHIIHVGIQAIWHAWSFKRDMHSSMLQMGKYFVAHILPRKLAYPSTHRPVVSDHSPQSSRSQVGRNSAHCWLDYGEELLSKVHAIWCSVHSLYQSPPGTDFR